MQHLDISTFCLRREKKESSFRWSVAFFCAPAKDKLLLLKAGRDLRGPCRKTLEAGGWGHFPAGNVCEREKEKERGE